MGRGPVTTRPHLLFVVTEDWYFVSHRLDLARAALAAGYRVSVATPDRAAAARIRDAGIALLPWDSDRGGIGPVELMRSVATLAGIYRRERPDIIHHVALKPTVIGGVAAAVTGMRRTLNAVAGLGWLYASGHALARVLRPPVRSLLRGLLTSERAHTLVQNPDDAAVFRRLGVPERRLHLVAGSGIDMRRFPLQDEAPGPPVVVLPARLLADKGVRELVAAARRLRAEGVAARFVLAGEPDEHNRSAIPSQELASWVNEGAVEHLGWVSDIPRLLATAHVVCLPSYREGLPKALLEAAAAGRCIVTTDVPGCRDVVRHGENGLLVTARDVPSLTAALRDVIQDPVRRRAMGRAGRVRAEREWSTDVITAQMLALYDDLLR